VDNSLVRLHDIKPAIEQMIGDSFLSTPLKERFLAVVGERMNRIFR